MRYIKLGFYILTAILTIVVIAYTYLASEDSIVSAQATGASVGLIVAAILGVACALAWLGFGVVQLADDKAKLKSAGIAIGALLVLFIIGYLTASGSLPTDKLTLEKFTNNGIATESSSRMIGALLNLPIILGAIAIIMIAVSEVKKAIS